ncbi:hypothetical protein QBC39DRAFT_361971 [Podospora conica]|nr:hypothetical protein QBC39DRAFT_361971 [Schizothecium conicum]
MHPLQLAGLVATAWGLLGIFLNSKSSPPQEIKTRVSEFAKVPAIYDKMAYMCQVQFQLHRTDHHEVPRTLYEVLGRSADAGFVLEDALVAYQKTLSPQELVGGWDDLQTLKTLVKNAIEAGQNPPKGGNPRGEALLHAFGILSDAEGRELYDEYLVPIFARGDPLGGLDAFCEWDSLSA